MTTPRTWLITGCSSGLGRELSAALLDTEDNLVLTARDLGKLKDIFGELSDRILFQQLDVTRPDQIDDVITAATRRFGKIDVLVNNAGYGHLGTIEDVPLDEVRALFETDFFAPILLIKAVLPAMRKARSGQIVNISSVGGLIGFPGSGYYCAAKFALVGLTESLRAELEPFGIKVMVVEPGPFNTDFSNRSLRFTPPASEDYDIAAGFERAGIKDWATRGDDPSAGAAALLKAINLHSPPLHLVLGAAGVDAVVERSRKRHEEFERWADFGRLDGEPPAWAVD